MTVYRFIFLSAVTLGLLSTLQPRSAYAQQFVVDDAAVVDLRACQLEAWHGRVSSWIQPACSFLPRFEITTGIGFVGDDRDGRETELVVEGKYIVREMRPNGVGIGVIAGVEFAPGSQTTGGPFESVYAYAPVSLSVADDFLIAHVNAGYTYAFEHLHDGHAPENDGARGEHLFTWGVRTDFAVHPRFTVISELFGENRLMPEYQVGLRTHVLPGRLDFDLSYTGHTQGDMPDSRWTSGLIWTPPPFL